MDFVDGVVWDASQDVREPGLRIDAVEFGRGAARWEAVRVFGASASFVINLIRSHERAGRVSALPHGDARHAKLTPHLDELISWIEETPDITL